MLGNVAYVAYVPNTYTLAILMDFQFLWRNFVRHSQTNNRNSRDSQIITCEFWSPQQRLSHARSSFELCETRLIISIYENCKWISFITFVAICIIETRSNELVVCRSTECLQIKIVFNNKTTISHRKLRVCLDLLWKCLLCKLIEVQFLFLNIQIYIRPFEHIWKLKQCAIARSCN